MFFLFGSTINLWMPMPEHATSESITGALHIGAKGERAEHKHTLHLCGKSVRARASHR